MDGRDELLDAACEDLLRYLRRSMPRQTERVAGEGLTLHQFRALIIVYSDEGCTTTDLADAVDVHPSVATGIVQRLVTRGFFRRVEDPEDRRIRRLYLTDEGRALAEEVAGTARATRRRQLEVLDDAQLAQLRTILATLVDGVEQERAERRESV
ncbi:MarR family winged helix-turn-helix transcriptional regulator [Demequina pelophila]|uniref:MarR family winged helix-turn-helix transcriptional regulator n=1 Tax=Demequina pelophila TaxID=1638984 RepID=UPI0007852AB4|nr:MarR family transcriptional regulator [Demequina pelophila]